MPRSIDAHQHFWKYDASEYGWITPEMGVLRRDFLMPDLAAEMAASGVRESIAVQARTKLAETEWLLSLAEAESRIVGVVGWVPLHAPDAERYVERYAANTKLVGLRHVVQDEPDDRYLLRPDFNAGISALKRFGLTYDILIYERHLATAIEFVDRHASQVFVLDHIAKPRIREKLLSPWREQIKDLARRPNVYCKLSGVVTEADWQNWQPRDLDPYLDVVLNAFTPQRLMFGSDWPVLLLAGGYRGWRELVAGKIAGWTEDERERVWGETAAEAYDL